MKKALSGKLRPDPAADLVKNLALPAKNISAEPHSDQNPATASINRCQRGQEGENILEIIRKTMVGDERLELPTSSV